MMRLLVILHMHYEDQAEYFIGKLSAISGCKWDLIVSSSSLSDGLRNRFTDFKHDVRFSKVENAGYDIWPFIKLIKDNDIDCYDVIIKLHSKNKRRKKAHINGWSYWGFGWRNELVDSLLGSPERFSEVLSAFDDPKTGMVCSRKLYAALNFEEDKEMLDNEMDRLGMKTSERRFCIGTMFAVRPQCLKLLKEQAYSVQMFEGESHSGARATLAHVYERILGILPAEYGYRVSPVNDPAFERRLWVKNHFDPAIKWFLTIDKDYDWRKYIQIFGFRIYLSNKA